MCKVYRELREEASKNQVFSSLVMIYGYDHLWLDLFWELVAKEQNFKFRRNFDRPKNEKFARNFDISKYLR